MKPSKRSKILVTSALPYANGPIHVGHLVEYIQTDIYVRFLKLTGHDAIYCCADDTHGTPIEIAAQKQGVQTIDIINKYHKEHQEDFKAFHIHFDSYHSTNSEENHQYADFIFQQLKNKDLIYQQDVELTYCEKCKRFLPDRYVKGRCPKCGADDQYGDVCERCNAAYTTIELNEPFCTICGTAPARKTSRHYFFNLKKCENQLKGWLASNKSLQEEVKNYVKSWIKDGLKDWDITRDGPYFGFTIPGEKDKYYYVWLDAPIGYIASTANYCQHKRGIDAGTCVDEYWKDGRTVPFIGKAIIYFHFLFWPAMLVNAGFRMPDSINVHGFLTVNGEKMSKSRGTFFTARQFLNAVKPEYLRYYYASHLARTMSDINLDFDDFRNRINNELVANVSNFIYRVLSFCNKNFTSQLTDFDDKELKPLMAQVLKKTEDCSSHYDAVNFREAVRDILEISSIGNKYFQDNAPWELLRNDKSKEAQSVVTFCANIANILSIVISPIMPEFSKKVQEQLDSGNQSWKDLGFKLRKRKIRAAAIITRKLENEFEQLKVKDPMALLDLRVAQVEKASPHPDADKLLVLQIDLGFEKRQLVAGLAAHYKPEDLTGKKIVVIANLKPAKLRGQMSAGMLLAGEENGVVRVLEANKSSPGEQVTVNGIEPDPAKEIKIDQVLEPKLRVNDGKPMYHSEVLRTKQEEITIKDVKKGSIK